MKCHIHNDRDAVATCKSCGKGLCSECTSEFQPPACRPCAELQSKQAYLARKKTVTITTVIGALGFVFGAVKTGIEEAATSGFIGGIAGGLVGGLAMAWVICGIYWGWAYVKPMLSSTILGMSATAMVRPSATYWAFIFGMCLTFLALMFGIAIGPFLFAKNLYKYIQDKNAYESVKSG